MTAALLHILGEEWPLTSQWHNLPDYQGAMVCGLVELAIEFSFSSQGFFWC